MSHSFSIIVPQHREISEVYRDAYLKIHDANGYIDGDMKSGSFDVKGVEGNYAIFNKRIDITLRKKPFFVTYAYVEKKINEYFT